MLYITTRGNKDAFTAYRTLVANEATDGGQFLPFAMSSYDANAISALASKSFGETVAELLNRFFSSQLTGWDVDFAIGRNAVKLVSMNHRIAIAELWHNPVGKFTYIVNSLYKKICGESTPADTPTRWVTIAVRISVLFGLYGELLRSGTIDLEEILDISVPADDFSCFMAAWYARKMGLPIGRIICTCGDGSALWDLINRGVFSPTDSDAALLPGVERLIQGTLGFDEANLFFEKCGNNCSYSIDEEQLPILNSDLFCAVTGAQRGESIVNSVFRSNNYIIDPETAVCYGGIQDYRAKVGDSRITLLFAEKTPMVSADFITSATGISKQKLLQYISLEVK